MLCKLLCLQNPQDHYGLITGSSIEIGLFSTTLSLAEEELCAPFRSYLEASPFFRQHLNARGATEGPSIEFENSSVQVVVGSEETHALGQSFFGALIDLPLCPAGSAPLGTVKDLYVHLLHRIQSRFLEAGRIPGLLILSASTLYATGDTEFIESLLARIQRQPACYLASVERGQPEPRP